MGFEFKNRKTTVEVCGKSYVIEKGSVDVAQRVDAMQKRMANMTESELNSPDAMKKVSDALRDICLLYTSIEWSTQLKDATRKTS